MIQTAFPHTDGGLFQFRKPFRIDNGQLTINNSELKLES